MKSSKVINFAPAVFAIFFVASCAWISKANAAPHKLPTNLVSRLFADIEIPEITDKIQAVRRAVSEWTELDSVNGQGKTVFVVAEFKDFQPIGYYGTYRAIRLSADRDHLYSIVLKSTDGTVRFIDLPLSRIQIFAPSAPPTTSFVDSMTELSRAADEKFARRTPTDVLMLGETILSDEFLNRLSREAEQMWRSQEAHDHAAWIRFFSTDSLYLLAPIYLAQTLTGASFLGNHTSSYIASAATVGFSDILLMESTNPLARFGYITMTLALALAYHYQLELAVVHPDYWDAAVGMSSAALFAGGYYGAERLKSPRKLNDLIRSGIARLKQRVCAAIF